MGRTRVDHINIGDPTTFEAGDTPRRITLQSDPESGGELRVSVQSLGWPGTKGMAGQFESHSCEEEIFMLRGSFDFQGYYTIRAGDYANHPPHWVHPSGQIASRDEPCIFLMRHSGPVDFFYDPIPAPYAGEFFAREHSDLRGVGVTRLATGALPWETAGFEGQSTDVTCKVLWRNPRTGWITWLDSARPGWQGSGPVRRFAGAGDEMFVLAGDLTTVRGDQQVTLTAGSYYCYPDEYVTGGASAWSEQGLLAVRWSRPPAGLELPLPFAERPGIVIDA